MLKMKKLKIILIILFLIPLNLNAQQNFINVPSSEITHKGCLFQQYQLNINNQAQFNSTIDYGLGSGFELGFNLLGLNYSNKIHQFSFNNSNNSEAYNPLLILNGLKQFKLNENSSINIGVHTGFNLLSKINSADLIYLNFRKENFLINNYRFVLGSYYNSIHYGGQGNRVGIWMASELILSNKFNFVLESILGNNDISNSSLGIIYNATKSLPLTFGLQKLNRKDSDIFFVFELTILAQK
jgi:hypothetical protein